MGCALDAEFLFLEFVDVPSRGHAAEKATVPGWDAVRGWLVAVELDEEARSARARSCCTARTPSATCLRHVRRRIVEQLRDLVDRARSSRRQDMGVHAEQYRHRVARPCSDLGGVDSRGEPGRDGRVP